MEEMKLQERTLVCNWLEVFCCQNFKKRQANIMAFLLRLSIESGSPKVHVPLLKDFEICGVSRTKIRYELEELEKSNVILWDRDDMSILINPVASDWRIKPHSKLNVNRLQQLIDLNSK